MPARDSLSTLDPAEDWDAARTARALCEARDTHWERPGRARHIAVRCQEAARKLGDPGLRARSLVVQGVVTLSRGDMRGAFALAAEAERDAERSGDEWARAEVASLKSQLSFFSGSYTEALRHAGSAIELSDATGDRPLQVFARRSACLVMGNLDAPEWGRQCAELVRLTVEIGDAWQEAVSRNDIAHWHMLHDDPRTAHVELARAMTLLERLAPHNRLGLAVVHCTRAEVLLRQGDTAAGLADAERALELLATFDEPNPYLFGMSVKLEVEALLALGRTDDAQTSGERAVARLGDKVPQARSMILATVASALREAGRVEDAYDTLARGAELERRALQELIELRLGLERSALETIAARHEADALAQKNRELEEVVGQLAQAHAELQERTAQLEALQERLREQADRDALTGLHNRRFLMATFDRLAREPLRGPFSVAVLDLDHFKTVNDRFGHAAGDHVLIRTAALLRSVVRTSDVVARTGGEEFVLLMPGADATAAISACERLLDALRRETWQRVGDGLRVTASVGIATVPDDVEASLDLEALSRVADERLYAAKRAGRDRVAATTC